MLCEWVRLGAPAYAGLAIFVGDFGDDPGFARNSLVVVKCGPALTCQSVAAPLLPASLIQHLSLGVSQAYPISSPIQLM
jgi:hypothetical protein